MEYRQTWKEKATPSGRLYWAHTASARPISDSESSGWPTPQARDHFPPHTDEYIAEKKAQGHGMANLNDVALLAGWPTPMAQNPDAGNCDYTRAMEAAMGLRESKNSPLMVWATPTVGDSGKVTPFHDAPQPALAYQAHLTGWCTPAARDHKDTPGMATTGTNPDGTERTRLDMLPRQAALTGPTPASLSAETGKLAASPGRLNPFFSAWLMGYPVAWTMCSLRVSASRSRAKSRTASGSSEGSATPSSRRSRQSSSKRSSKPAAKAA